VGGGLVLAVSLAGAGAAAWLAYLRWKDRRRPEPLALLVALLAAGAVSVAGALYGYRLLEKTGAVVTWDALAGPWPSAAAAALAIGAVEEIAKLVPVLCIALGTRHFDEIWDGPIYAAVAGVGFAAAETVALFLGGAATGPETLARAVAAPITHALFAAPWGLGLARWVLEGRAAAFAVGLAASALLHGAYDLLLARPGLQPAAAAVVLALWIWLLVTGRRLARA
jgi:RsiW-degrading membrane proteinase PrsW (M82 family)